MVDQLDISANLDRELSEEIERFTTCARRQNRLEALMRLRALTEISNQLDIERLLAIAVWVSAERHPARRAN